VEKLPIVYVRGYAGPTAGIDTQLDAPFYGFNKGATHVRVDGRRQAAVLSSRGRYCG